MAMPTTNQVFKGILGSSQKDTVEKTEMAIPCEILHGKKRIGSGVLVCNQNVNDDNLSKHFMITSKIVIKDMDFADQCKVEFCKKKSKVTFDLMGVIKSVIPVASGVVIIFIDSSLPEFKHEIKKCRKFPLTIADFDKNHSIFCYVANKWYNINIESNNENAKYVLKDTKKNSDASAQLSNGTVILQGAKESNRSAVGIFDVVDEAHMVISPLWLKPSISEISAETPAPPKEPEIPANVEPDGPSPNIVSPSPAVSDTASAETPAPPKEPEIPANLEPDGPPPSPAGSVTANANQQPTSGANGTDDVDVDASASENDENNGTQQPGSINSTPVQEDQGDVHTRAGEEIDQHEGTVSEKDKSLLHKLAVQLDKTPHRVVKDWEFLANTPEINAPLHVWLRCRIRTERSCTLLLFDVLRAGFAKKTLGNMIDALEEIKRRDVNRIITAHCSEVYPNAVYRTMNFWEFDIKNRQLVRQMAVMLDEKSLVKNYWRHLGGSSQFKLTELRLEEIEQSAQIGGQPTQILMAYLYTEVKNLTIKTFYDVIKNFEKPREDVLAKLDQFMDENPIFRDPEKHMKEAIDLHGELMRDICVLFNQKIPGVKNWRHLAEAFDVPEEVKKDCEPGKAKSPTETLFQWVFAEKDPPLTVGQLCKAFKGIKRIDLVNVVKDYFKN